jgi:streptomycin 6-kinase
MKPLPQSFTQKVNRIFGEAGSVWLPQLPEIVAQCRETWGLAEGTLCPFLSMNYIEFTTTRDGRPVALKIGVPHQDLFTEMEALALYNGRGTVRLLGCNPERGALLLQRAMPGTMLWQVGDNAQQTQIAASAMLSLLPQVPERTQLPHFSQWTERAFRLTRTEWDPEERWPRDLLERAEAIMNEVSPDRSRDVVLHGDLHHENILWDDGDGWVVIDPKGVIGPRWLEAGRYIQNQLPDDVPFSVHEALVRERVEIFSNKLSLPAKKIVAGALVDCVLGHVWSFEDEGPLDESWYQGIELGRLLCRMLDER